MYLQVKKEAFFYQFCPFLSLHLHSIFFLLLKINKQKRQKVLCGVMLENSNLKSAIVWIFSPLTLSIFANAYQRITQYSSSFALDVSTNFIVCRIFFVIVCKSTWYAIHHDSVEGWYWYWDESWAHDILPSLA